MFIQEITYTDFNGNETTEKLYFNLSQSELIKMNLEDSGKLKKMIESVQTTQDPGDVFTIVETVILGAYGVKSEDGKRFIKTVNGEPLSKEFQETAAYAALFDDLLTDPDKLVAFINNVAPATQQVQSSVKNLPSK